MNISFRGHRQLADRLEKMRAQYPDGIRRTMAEAIYYVHSTVPPYPSKPEGSTYRRTGTLGRSINTEVRSVGTEMIAAIGTNVVYAPWVISSEPVAGPPAAGPQARVHVGRWWTLQKVVENARGKVDEIISRFIARLTGG